MQKALDTDLKQGYAILASQVKAAKERDTYLPAKLETDDRARLIATPLNWHGSSDFIGFARSEALIVVPTNKSFDKGEVVEIAYL
jgi:molybdopterin biosynthesis enzyme